MEDKDLIQRIKKGDDRAFHDLYEKYGEYALRAAGAITRNHAAAADAVQETFIRVYHHIHSFDTDKDFKPWFYKILLNECKRLMKDRTRTVPISDYMENYSEAAENDDYRFEEYEELYRAIKKLKEIHRIPIILKYLNDFTEAEIADVLGMNVNSVKSRLFKGRKKLKEALERFDERRMGHG